MVEVSEVPHLLRGSVRVYSSGGLLHLLCLCFRNDLNNISLELYKVIYKVTL